jgi:hypothetical protein
MKRALCMLTFVLILGLGSNIAHAATNPAIAGNGSGLEFCPQFICGVAIFAGGFHGQIGSNFSANGIVSTALTHGDLPTDVGASTPIYSGVWQLQTLLRRFDGVVLGGSITYIGDNRFHVQIALLVTSGGSGTLKFDGILDHNPLIPTFGGSFN